MKNGRLKSPNDITDEGAIRLICAILDTTREAYITDYAYMLDPKKKQRFEELDTKHNKLVDYIFNKAYYQKLDQKKKRLACWTKKYNNNIERAKSNIEKERYIAEQKGVKYVEKPLCDRKETRYAFKKMLANDFTPEEEKFYIEFPLTKKPRKLTPKEKSDYSLMSSKSQNISETEHFYKSEDFQTYTLNRGLVGEEVIAELQKRAKDLYQARINHKAKRYYHLTKQSK